MKNFKTLLFQINNATSKAKVRSSMIGLLVEYTSWLRKNDDGKKSDLEMVNEFVNK